MNRWFLMWIVCLWGGMVSWGAEKFPEKGVFRAVETGDLATVRQWIEVFGTDVNVLDSADNPLIFGAAQQGNREIFQYLVTQGADLKRTGELGTLLHVLAQRGDLEWLKELVEQAGFLPEYNTPNTSQSRQTILECALESGRLELVQYLIVSGSIDAQAWAKQGGDTLLRNAAQSGNLEVVTYLEALGAAPDTTSRKTLAGAYDSVLHRAAASGQVAMIQHFLPKFPSSETIPDVFQESVLKQAAKSGNSNVFHFLVETWKPSAEFLSSGECLSAAAEGGNVELVRELREKYGADFREAEALFGAIQGKHPEMIRYLVENGMDVRVESTYGTSPVTLALSFLPDEVPYLLEKGAVVEEHTLIQTVQTDDLRAIRAVFAKIPGFGPNALVAPEVLCSAITHGEPAVVQFLMEEKGLNESTWEEEEGKNELPSIVSHEMFVQAERRETMRYLVEKQGFLRWRSVDVSDLLSNALTVGNFDVAQCILQAAQTMGISFSADAWNLTCSAVEGGNARLVRLVVETLHPDLSQEIPSEDDGIPKHPLHCFPYWKRSLGMMHGEHDCLAIYRYLIGECGMDPNGLNDQEETPIFHGYDQACVEYLLSVGAFVHVTNNNQDNPLHTNTDPKILRLLVEQGANKDAQNQFGDTPLHRAAGEADIEKVQTLVALGADLNIENRQALFPVECAPWPSIVEYLLSQGALYPDTKRYLFDLESALRQNDSPRFQELLKKWNEMQPHVILEITDQDACEQILNQALELGNLEAIACWMEHFSLRKNKDLFHAILFSGRVDILRCFLEHGIPASPDLLSIAIRMERLEIVKYLVEQGAVDVRAVDSGGQNALQTAAKTSVRILQYLAKQANVDFRSPEGSALLQHAETPVLQYLLRCGADPNVCDADGKTPLMNGDWESDSYFVRERFLLEYGADIHRTDTLGETVLTRVAATGNIPAYRWFVAHGADPHYRMPNGQTPEQILSPFESNGE